MFGFMLKKAFFDYWDNFFHFAILNIVIVFSLAIPTILPGLILDFSPLVSLVVLIIGLLWLGVLASAVSLYVNEIAHYRGVEVRQFFAFIKSGAKSGLLWASIWITVVLLVWFTFPFYSAMDNLGGLAALAFLFWTLVIFVLAMQYYFPIRAQLHSESGKSLRKMFIVFFDNALFSIGLFFISAIVLLVSGVTAFVLFGPAGVILLGQVAFKLRLYKYDYLEENPASRGRKIPWSALVHEDRQRIGKRSLKGMVFPWKG